MQRKYLSSPISENCKPNKTAPKHNLALRVLQEAAKLNIEIKELIEESSSLNLKGTEITNLLNNKELYSFVNSDKMNLFILEQLIDSSGSSLLIWQQLKYTRREKRKGRIPSWFTKLEEKTLKRKDSRELQDIYKVERPNRSASKLRPKEISEDKRKKEWFLFKKDGKLHIGKTIRKTKKSVVATHWKENKHAIEGQSFLKCERCNIGSFNNNDCLISINYKK